MIVLAGSYHMPPERFEEAKRDYFDWLLSSSRNEDGVLQYELARDFDDPSKIVCLAVLKDAQALNAHRDLHTEKWEIFSKKFGVFDWDVRHYTCPEAAVKKADPREDALAARR